MGKLVSADGGSASNVELQPETTSKIRAKAGAVARQCAFRVMSQSSYTAMHNKITIGEDGFKQIYAQ